MSQLRVRRVVTSGLRAHPAVAAWLKVSGDGPMPGSVAVMRECAKPFLGIYRLPGIGAGGSTVYARQASPARLGLERLIYEYYLPQLGVTSPRYYGSCADERGGWLFLEDVGEQRYSRGEPEHLRLAARWLGALHVGAVRLGKAADLPDAGPARYLGQLRAARETIQASLGRWTFPLAEVEILAGLLSRLRTLEGCWDRVAEGCDGAPATLVHGDFRPKNAHVQVHADRLDLFPMDWEMAGWGKPAVDLTRIDLEAYWEAVREAWPGVDLAAVERMARFGRLLQTVAAVEWETQSLPQEGAENRSAIVADLSRLTGELLDAVRVAGLEA